MMVVISLTGLQGNKATNVLILCCLVVSSELNEVKKIACVSIIVDDE
jgi:hypothetical protein